MHLSAVQTHEPCSQQTAVSNNDQGAKKKKRLIFPTTFSLCVRIRFPSRKSSTDASDRQSCYSSKFYPSVLLSRRLLYLYSVTVSYLALEGVFLRPFGNDPKSDRIDPPRRPALILSDDFRLLLPPPPRPPESNSDSTARTPVPPPAPAPPPPPDRPTKLPSPPTDTTPESSRELLDSVSSRGNSSPLDPSRSCLDSADPKLLTLPEPPSELRRLCSGLLRPRAERDWCPETSSTSSVPAILETAHESSSRCSVRSERDRRGLPVEGTR